MPDNAGGFRIRPGTAVRQLREWIQKVSGNAAIPLTSAQRKQYVGHSFSHGWALTIIIEGKEYVLYILITNAFPYSLPRVALASEDKFLEWPHVEKSGLLCLPILPLDSAHPEEMARSVLDAACDLINSCLSNPIASEFGREFVLYWNQSCDDVKSVRSLISLDGPTRPLVAWYGKTFDLVGDTEQQVASWLIASGLQARTGGLAFCPAVFVNLPQPPPPFIFGKGITELRTALRESAPDALALIEQTAPKLDKAILVLGAETDPERDWLPFLFTEEKIYRCPDFGRDTRLLPLILKSGAASRMLRAEN